MIERLKQAYNTTVFNRNFPQAVGATLEAKSLIPSESSYARRILALILSGEIVVQPMVHPKEQDAFVLKSGRIEGFEEKGIYNIVEIRPYLVSHATRHKDAMNTLFECLKSALDFYDKMVTKGKHIITRDEVCELLRQHIQNKRKK